MQFFLVMRRHELVVDELEGRSAVTWLVLETGIDEANCLEWNVSTSWDAVVTLAQHVHELREGLRIEGRPFCEESVDQTAESPYIHVDPELLII